MTEVKNADATVVAATLEETLVGLKRDGVPVEKIRDESLIELFTEFQNGLFVKAAIPEILRQLANAPGERVQAIVDRMKLRRMTAQEMEALVREHLKETSDKNVLIKRVMEKCRLRCDGSEIVRIINKIA
jgi:Glu-tRNA(Gln) amidotransferase subunit E-like FAD-binding protein